MSILAVVSDFYQRHLFGKNPKAVDFLTEFGITSRPTIDAFKVGFATNDLVKALNDDQKEELRILGLIKANVPRFSSAITFPLFDLEGNIIDILGRVMGKSCTSKTIKDTPKGIGHPEVLKATDDVICTDMPMVALELHQSGYHNVMLVPHASCFAMFKAKRITVLSPRFADELSTHAQADEVLYANIRQRDKNSVDALSRLKHYKGKPTPIITPKASGLLDKVVDDLTTLGYAGEATNKKIAYLVAISRKLKRPLSAIIVSSSGAGKSSLMRMVCELVPEFDRIQLSRLTPQAMYYFPEDALNEKLIVVDERSNNPILDQNIRIMQTSNTLTLANASKKKGDDGVRTIKVNCSYMESTTTSAINPENASRCLILHLDESSTATEAVLKSQREKRMVSHEQGHSDIIRWHQDFQKGLKSLPIYIPFIGSIRFPNHKVIYRREQEKFLSLIESSALLHQAERAIINDVIQATIEDYTIAYDLFTSVFEDAEQEVSLNALKLIETLERENITSFTMRQALTLTGMSYGTLYNAIKELLNYSYLETDRQTKGRHQRTYTIIDYSDHLMKSGGITLPSSL